MNDGGSNRTRIYVHRKPPPLGSLPIREWLEAESKRSVADTLSGWEFDWTVTHIVEETGVTTTSQRRLWFASRGSWRLSEDFDSSSETQWRDAGVFEGLGWKLTPSWVVLVDAASEEPPTGHNVVKLGEIMAEDAALFCFGGLHILEDLTGAELEVSPDGDAWTLHATTRGGATALVQGTFDPAAARGLVRSVELYRKDTKMQSWRFDEWSVDRASGLAFARHVEISDQAATHRLSLNRSVAITEHTSMLMREGPSGFDSTDWVRGRLATTRITDFRVDPPVERFLRPDESVLELPTREYVLNLAREEFSMYSRALAVLTTGLIIAIRLAVSKRHSTPTEVNL